MTPEPYQSGGSSPPRKHRSVTHGTCALDGKHSSEAIAAECPVLGKTAQERLQAWRGTSQDITCGARGITEAIRAATPGSTRVKRVLTPEHLQALAAGRARARQTGA